MGRPSWTRMCAVAIAASVVSASLPAYAADPSEGSAAAAESLFQDGRRLADAKKYGEACPKFLASHKLAPAVGTLLNLADCYEKNGQLASAWARFHEAISLAQRLNRPEREKVARDRADKLESRLIRLTIEAADKNAQVSLDGNVLDAAVLGTALPVDPGKHTVEAKAPQKKTFTTTLDTSEQARAPTLEIPKLEDEPDSPAASANAGFTEPPAETPPGGFPQKPVALAVGAVGVVGLGVGVFFGLRANQRWSDAKTYCNPNLECDADGLDLAAKARNSATASTVGFIAGGALVAVGAVLFITAPKRGVRVGVGPGTVSLGGAF